MTNQKLRWGILSTAKIGLEKLIPAVRLSSNGVVHAIASRNDPTAQEAAGRLQIPRAFGSYEALLESPEVDAIYNPLPNSLHREWSIRAAERGKHVLCEKPFAMSAAEVDEMIAAAKSHRVLLMEAFMYRFHPQYDRVREWIARGEIGRLQILRSAFGFHLQDFDNIRMIKELGGGSAMDLGCYCVNWSRLIAGAEPLAVQAAQVIGERSGVEETLGGLLRFPQDIVAHFDSSFRTAQREGAEIQGSEGRIELTRPFLPGFPHEGKLILHHGKSRQEFELEPINHYQLMVEHFADAVLNGTPLRYPPELDRANMRVIDALYESARTGKSVELT